MSVTALIVDDEPALRGHLRRQLAGIWPELSVAGEADNGKAALEMIKTLNPAVAFLDIRMPGLDGLEVARRLAQDDHPCHVVFVTAYDNHAVDAFEHSAVDYLLKPVTEQRLVQCVARLQDRLKGPRLSPPELTQLLTGLRQAVKPAYRQWLKVNKGDDVHLLAVAEIDYLKAADKYVSVYAGGKEWIVRLSLRGLEAELDPAHFWRIHRSIVVRVAAVKRATRDLAGRWTVEFKHNNHTLPVSRAYAYRFKED